MLLSEQGQSEFQRADFILLKSEGLLLLGERIQSLLVTLESGFPLEACGLMAAFGLA